MSVRRWLLGATALLPAAPALAQGGAEPVRVRIGGYFEAHYAYVADNADRGALRNAPNFRTPTGSDFRTDTEFFLAAEGRTAGGLTYGAVLEFQVDFVGGGQGGTGAGTTLDTDQMFVFLSTPGLGTLRFGDIDAAAWTMQVRAPGAPGRDRINNLTRAEGPARYMFTPILDGNDATKVVYLSPQFFGFDFGLSYALIGAEGEREVLPNNSTLQRQLTTRYNEGSAALRWRGRFAGVGVTAGFAMLLADAPRATAAAVRPSPRVQDPSVYNIGLQLSHRGFTVGGAWQWGRYAGQPPGITGAPVGRGDSWMWLVGASWQQAPWTIGVNYGQAGEDTRTGREGDLRGEYAAIGANLALAPGLSAYALYEYHFQRNLNLPVGGIPAGGNRTQAAFTTGLRMAF